MKRALLSTRVRAPASLSRAHFARQPSREPAVCVPRREQRRGTYSDCRASERASEPSAGGNAGRPG